jgi:hypothetical protein
MWGWIKAVDEKLACLEPGSPWESRYNEVFYSLQQVQILMEDLSKQYNTKITHIAPFNRPSAPDIIV